jgi:hypothetical protein
MTMPSTLRLAALVATLASLPGAVVAQTSHATESSRTVPSPTAHDSPIAPRLERIDAFIGLDGSKQPQDLGVNANMGPRVAVNVSLLAVRRAGIGVRIGQAVNVADAAVSVLARIDGTSSRTQSFSSVGLYQNVGRVSWRVGYDLLYQSYFDSVWLGQWRGSAGVTVGERNEVAAWFTLPARSSDATIGDATLSLRSMTQVAGVIRHHWPSGARTGIWAGVSGGHHDVVLVFPENNSARRAIVYGADLDVPLNDRWSIVGATNLVTPAASGTVDAFMGVTTFLGRRRHGDSRTPGVADVANNTSFPVDLIRR